ncbi:IMS domain-containing protein [Leptolyngbya sp. FACHB-261]|uniref:IMS domain-containing protein n=1 Tax=Leptolyngbya sp. FACHB-261 TaxID=2692806 RepID=UPI001688E3FC|nr:IMS domain-containing protein [Leptolyngbya sp. FACHB-261]MBD2099508.1 DUF4101 domain-containing protein [Leptolyngbya sp. FACHB-261]
MRIPLDYYRILGLPAQATPEQLQQAHRDRSAQLPRREYSDSAISARRQLLDQAYGVLFDPEQRRGYDAEIGAGGREPIIGEASLGTPTPGVPSLEIRDDLMPGALLLLLELGEYELVLRLGQACLVPGSDFAAPTQGSGKRNDPDVVLTLALASLELGREHWQQGKYEAAAAALQQGQDLLLREGLFASVRGEIQAELYKLRPYRILELLALAPEQNPRERQRGLLLLQEMLEERGGIDGTGNDRSGLGIDDFLRFIQQLRSYLSAAEQQALFEDEARRPSAVATYLAVYALLARGFAQRQPALIRRARGMLVRLGQRQDVHLEQAVCALLLGQTEEASRSLELSREYKPLAFIRQHSQGSPDLLPGLCLYAERWLQDEVFPHFRDLSQQRAALKDYFADDQVQSYLEALPLSSDSDPDWAVLHNSTRPEFTRPIENLAAGAVTANRLSNISTATLSPPPRSIDAPRENGSRENSSNRANPTKEPLAVRERGNNSYELPSATDLPPRRPRGGAALAERPLGDRTGSPSAGRRSGGGRRLQPLRVLILVTGALLLLGGGAWALQAAYRAVFKPGQTTGGDEPSVYLERPVLPIAAADGTAPAGVAVNADRFDATVAEQLIQNWQASKARAMGPEHEIPALDAILVDPSLSDWRGKATTLKDDNAYWQYELKRIDIEQIEVNDQPVPLDGSAASPTPGGLEATEAADPASPTPDAGLASPGLDAPETAQTPTIELTPPAVEPAPTATAAIDGDTARVIALVGESRRYFANGTEDESLAADSEYRVEYEFVRQGGKWLIRTAQALE